MSNENSISSMHLVKSSVQQNALQNGSNIFVRVLSKGRGSEYLVSFAGNKVSVFSQKELTVGTAFRAIVSLKDGKIYLSPQNSTYQNNIQKFSGSDSNLLTNLSSFLQEMGLNPDGFSLRLVQYFQSAGFSFNAKLASKARSIGLQFPGKEEDAAEIALFLEQKGIRAETTSVMELLSILYGDDFHQSDEKEDEEGQSDEKNQDDEQEIIPIETSFSSVKERGNNIDSEQTTILDAIYKDAIKVLNRKGNLLTFINHSRTASSHWVILPFESDTTELKIRGTIRLLVDLNKKNTEKMIIFAFLGGYNYKLMIKCANRGVSANQQRYSVQICTDKQDIEQNGEHLCELLRSCLPKDLECDVFYSKDLENEGIFTLGSVISVVKLDA